MTETQNVARFEDEGKGPWNQGFERLLRTGRKMEFPQILQKEMQPSLNTDLNPERHELDF